MFHFIIYKTINLINGKFYIGMHKTKYPNDGYLGSGTIVSRAIKKYGKENFKKVILFDFDTQEEMVVKEKEIVTEDFLKRPDVYNLNVGGDGGWYRANQVVDSDQRREAGKKGHDTQRILMRENPEFRARKHAQARYASQFSPCQPPSFEGKKHSPETIERMRATRKGLRRGPSNSQFDTVWVCKAGERSKKAKKSDLDALLKEGWVRGRVA